MTQQNIDNVSTEAPKEDLCGWFAEQGKVYEARETSKWEAIHNSGFIVMIFINVYTAVGSH